MSELETTAALLVHVGFTLAYWAVFLWLYCKKVRPRLRRWLGGKDD